VGREWRGIEENVGFGGLYQEKRSSEKDKVK
jgi:hypothetical protein